MAFVADGEEWVFRAWEEVACELLRAVNQPPSTNCSLSYSLKGGGRRGWEEGKGLCRW